MYKTPRKVRRQARRNIERLGAKISQYVKIFELSKTKELLEVLSEIGVDVGKLPIFPSDVKWIKILLSPHLEGQLCLECLREQRIVYHVTDHKTGEVVCPYCGTVKMRDFSFPF